MSKYRHLKISLTNSCNIDCRHCYLGTKTALHADLVLVLHRIEEAETLGVQILDLTGGEPTTHPSFCKILDAVGNSAFDRLNLSTNGLGLTREDILPRLESYEAHCNISLDGATATTVNTIRGRNVFRRLEDVFTVLKSRDVSFSLRFSINRLNVNEVKEMLYYAEHWGVKAELEPSQLIGNASRDILLDATQALNVKQTIEALRSHLSITIEESFTKPYPCDGGFPDLLSLNVRGIGVTCLMMTHKDQRKEPIESVSLAEMWDQIQDRKRRMREFHPRFPQCPTCKYYRLCVSGCWVTAYSVGCYDAS